MTTNTEKPRFDRHMAAVGGDGRTTVVKPEQPRRDLLRQELRKLGMEAGDDEVERMINEFDIDGNGTIEQDEFVQMMAKKMHDREKLKTEREYRRAFDIFDQNHNGYICTADLVSLMDQLGEKITKDEISDMLEVADLDKDGQVSYDEFVSVVTGNPLT